MTREVFLRLKDRRLRGRKWVLSLCSGLWWQCGLVGMCLGWAGLVGYEATFRVELRWGTLPWAAAALVASDSWCLADACLCCLQRLARRPPARPLLLMALDLLTSWPALTLHYLLSAPPYCAPVVYLRTYRLLGLVHRLWTEVLFFENVFLCFIVSHVAFLYAVACVFQTYVLDRADYRRAMVAYFPGFDVSIFDDSWKLEGHVDFFLFSSYVAVQIFCRKAIHYLLPPPGVEEVVVLMTVGAEGTLINALKAASALASFETEQVHRRMFRRFLSEGLPPEEMAARFWLYVDTLWRERCGVLRSRMEAALPPGLHADSRLDTYLEALSHSPILNDLDSCFLGALASRMVTEFHAPGDRLYDSLSLKNKMIYVRRGVVEILSPEDGETVLFSFGEGTCLGDASLVVPFPNVAPLKCATYCEIQTLYKRNIADLYAQFPNEFKIIADKTATVFLEGRKARRYARNVRKVNRQFAVGRSPTEPTEWVAAALDKLCRASAAASPTDTVEVEDILNSWEEITDQDFSGRAGRLINHLHKLTPVRGNDYRTDAVFLTKHCPLKLYPDSSLTRFTEGLVVAAVLLLLLITPYKAAISVSTEEDLLTIFIQIAFLIDLVVQCVTTVRHRGFLITEAGRILDNRAFSPRFLASAVSVVPFHYIAKGYGPGGGPYFAIFRCYQLINWWRVKEMYSKFEDSILVGRKLWRYVVLSVILGYGSYVSGAIYFMSTCFNRECHPKGWWAIVYGPLSDYTNYKVILYSLGHGLMIISGSPLYNTKPATMAEHVVLSLLSIGGLIFGVKYLSWMTGSAVAEGEVKFRFVSSVSAIRYVLAKRATGSGIEQRATDYLRSLWDNSQGYGVFEVTSLTRGDLDPELESEIKFARWFDLALRVDLFKYFGEKFIGDILRISRLFYLPPNEVLVYRGQAVDSIFLLDKGYCELLSDDGSSSIKSWGMVFCLVESMLNLPCLCTVRSKTSCTLLMIRKDEIFRAMTEYQYDYRRVIEVLKKGAILVNLPYVETTAKEVALELVQQMPHFPSIIKPVDGFVDEQKYPIKKQEITHLWSDRIFKFFLWKVIIIQTGKLFLFWELFRCCMALLSAFLFPAHFIVSLYWKKVDIAYWCLDLTAYLDIYFKFHVGYYREGVLIRDRILNAKRYGRTWFWLDLAACLPLQLITSNYIVGNYNRILQIYRVFAMLSTLKSDVTKDRNYIVYPRFLILVVTFINAVTNALIYSRCEKGSGGGAVLVGDGLLSCHFENWSELGYKIPTEIDRLVLILIYWVCLVVMQTRQSAIALHWFHTEPAFISSVVVSVVITIYFLSSIASDIPIETTLVYSYQLKIAHMKKFLDEFNANDRLKRHFIAHYRLCWSNLLGMNYSEIFEPFPFGLRQDILLKIYGETLSKYSVFEVADVGFYRSLLNIARVSFFVKDSTAIQPKQVNNDLYMIHRGYATVTDPAGIGRYILGRGDLFGKMEERQIFQYETVMAESNMEVLIFDHAEFNRLLKTYPRIKQVYELSVFFDSHNANDRYQRKEKDYYVGEETEYVENLIVSVQRWELIKLVLAIIVFCWSAYLVGTQSVNLWALMTAYCLEVTTLLAVFMSYAPWLSKEAEGALAKSFVTYYSRVRRQMYMDLVALVPLELVYLAATRFAPDPLPFALMRLNRGLLLLTMKEFCWRNSYYLGNISRATIRLVLAAVVSATLIHAAACAIVFCLIADGYVTSEDLGVHLYGRALTLVLCAMSKYGIAADMEAKGRLVQGLEIVLVVLTKPLGAALVREFLIYFRLVSHFGFDYIRESRKLRKLMRVTGASHVLIDVVDDYSRKMYGEKGGEAVPQLIAEAPQYLYRPFAQSAFGRHLEKSSPFAGCDEHLLAQISAHLKLHVYFPGNVLVRAGVADCSMYFVHAGQVEVVAALARPRREVVVRTLRRGEYFGAVQGLFPKVRHKANYRATTTVLVLKLDYNDWKHYLDFFPVAKNRIYSRYEDLS
ncbi:hypothetical protein AAG570_013814 [Ranatra chinensis]|uniref:Cyclic nucleotide-binding domain-containing protein n=1 Tax=Ranatra chinensis TaxID=642074 RepID=A0ABD0YD97_9HEMI